MLEEKYHKITLKKVIGPTTSGTALILGNDEKTFVMFVGLYEGAAILRELNNDKPPRPLTHELIASIMMGFDIHLKKVIISDIIENTFVATLVLEQIQDEGDGQPAKRQEVRIDARPSDCIIMALKEKVDICATDAVLEKSTDIKTEILEKSKDFLDFNWKNIDFTSSEEEEDDENDFLGEDEKEDEKE